MIDPIEPTEPWPADATGVLELADGRRVRGRGVRAGAPEGPEPTFGLYLLGKPPPVTTWEARWVRWPDFRLPRDPDDAVAALRDAFDRAATGRVEVACGGGAGRTGTALACLAVLAGTPPDDAVAFVRAGYRSRAVETPAQRRFVTRFRP
ncbi:MAG TPA: protein-tyrosine phosphatase family protein [Iamia sp.]|nr:protein-tyrosine phosphatase family protein [Iamia sp.]